MGLSLSRGITPFLSFLCHSILLFDPRREHSFAATALSIAVARSGGQGRCIFSAAEDLSLTDGSTAAWSGGWPRDDPRRSLTLAAINRANQACIRLNPYGVPDHEAVIRFCGQGSEAAGPFSQRHCSHSRRRIAATSDRHRLPGASSAVRCRTLFVLSRSRVLLTAPTAARHRPEPRRS